MTIFATELPARFKTVECNSCGRVMNIEPALMSRDAELVNAGHANIDRGIIQCACGRQL